MTGSDLPYREIVFDTSCLSHFALIDRIDLLADLLKRDRCHLPSTVREEIRVGAENHPLIKPVLSQDWLIPYSFDTLERLQDLSRWIERVVAGNRNLGEAGVLAAAEALPGVALIDDRQARRVGMKFQVKTHGTLWLLAEARKSKALTEASAASLVDDLKDTGMRLPCSGSDFDRFAKENGLL